MGQVSLTSLPRPLSLLMYMLVLAYSQSLFFNPEANIKGKSGIASIYILSSNTGVQPTNDSLRRAEGCIGVGSCAVFQWMQGAVSRLLLHHQSFRYLDTLSEMGRIMREMRSSRILANPEVRKMFTPLANADSASQDDSIAEYPEQSTSARPNKRSADNSELPYSHSPAQKARTDSGEQEDLTEVQYSEETIPADLKKCASFLL